MPPTRNEEEAIMKRPAGVFVLGAALIVLLLSTGSAFAQAATSAWDQVVAAAKKEGDLVMYGSWSPEAHKKVADAFEATNSLVRPGSATARMPFTVLPWTRAGCW
jgi:hypothetical protein